jgi:hypothetical protein
VTYHQGNRSLNAWVSWHPLGVAIILASPEQGEKKGEKDYLALLVTTMVNN